MRISILASKIRVDLLIVRTRCLSEVYLTEVPLKAFPCRLFLFVGALRPSTLPFPDIPILPLKGGGDPMRWRCSSGFCLVADRGIDFIAEFEEIGRAHV